MLCSPHLPHPEDPRRPPLLAAPVARAAQEARRGEAGAVGDAHVGVLRPGHGAARQPADRAEASTLSSWFLALCTIGPQALGANSSRQRESQDCVFTT
jgi:hypothetical protein